jgi:VWFA-related protein
MRLLCGGPVMASAAAAVLGLLAPAGAEDGAPRFEGGVEIVAVDANAVDAKGQPVRDLTPGEFLVKVDGRPRRVVSAEFVSLPGAASPGTVTPTGADSPAASIARRPAGRRFVLIIDRGQLSAGAVRAATQAAARLLEELTPDDRVALFTLPSGARVDFTADRAALEKALGRVGPAQDRPMGEFEISLAEAASFVDQRARAAAVSERECLQFEKLVSPRAGPRAPTPSDSRPYVYEQCIQRVEAEARRQIDDHERSLQDRLDSLEALCQALTGVPGPKVLILASGGFASAVQGRTRSVAHQLRRIATVAAAARATLYSLYFPQRAQDVSAALTRASYTLDEDHQLRAAGLGTLTGLAGGAMFDVVAGADFAFRRVAAETSGHYLLGLEPAKNDRDGKPHDIEVKVLRAGLDVRARRQFVMAAEARAPVKKSPLAPRVTPPASPFRLATHVLRGGAAGQIKVVMAAQVDGFSDARLDVKVLDPTGAVVGTLLEHVQSKEAPVRYQETLLLPRGLYTLKGEATDAGGRRAVVEAPLNAELAHSAGFDLSDLVLLEPVDGKMRFPASGSVTSDLLGVYLELYMHEELPADGLGITVEVVGADGARRAVALLTVQTDEDPRLLFAEGTLDLSRLLPGAYVARAAVTLGTRVARRVERAFDFKGRARPAPTAIQP